MSANRNKLAKALHEDLSQQLAGTLLAAGALSARLTRRHAPEATEAAYLMEMLMKANNELTRLIKNVRRIELRNLIAKREGDSLIIGDVANQQVSPSVGDASLVIEGKEVAGIVVKGVTSHFRV